MNSRKTVKQLIDHFGGQSAVAKLLGIRQQSVYGWLQRGIPVSRALTLIHLSEGKFSITALRPDLFCKSTIELLRKY